MRTLGALGFVIAMSAAPASVSLAQSTNLLTVYGYAWLADGTPANHSCTVTVRNLTRGTSAAGSVQDGSKYVVTFVDYDGNIAAAVGDEMQATLKDSTDATIGLAAYALVGEQGVITHQLLLNVNDAQTAVGDLTPDFTILSPPFPEPFAWRAHIRYQLRERSHVAVRILDMAGRLVTTLVDEDKSTGYYEQMWSGEGISGRRAPPGVYYLRLETPTYINTRRTTLIR
jgi:flagellar hook capping protein FlgD